MPSYPQHSSVDGVPPKMNRFSADFVARYQKREEEDTTDSKEDLTGATTLMKYGSRMLYRLSKRTQRCVCEQMFLFLGPSTD